MALNTFKCNCLTPLHFRRSIQKTHRLDKNRVRYSGGVSEALHGANWAGQIGQCAGGTRRVSTVYWTMWSWGRHASRKVFRITRNIALFISWPHAECENNGSRTTSCVVRRVIYWLAHSISVMALDIQIKYLNHSCSPSLVDYRPAKQQDVQCCKVSQHARCILYLNTKKYFVKVLTNTFAL